MKLQRVIHAVMFEPWLILPSAHHSIRTLVESKLAGRPTEGFFGERLPQAEIRGKIGYIPVFGVLGRGFGDFEKSCGAVGVEDIEAELLEFAHNPSVSGIMLDFNSPGGTVGGIPELSDVIAQVDDKKPVYAWVSDMAASAAYWLASSARRILGSKTSEVGSIGVYIPWIDETQAYEAAGLKVDLIKNTGGDYKGMGYPGTSLTEEQRAKLQEQVDQVFGMFSGHVFEKRKKSTPDAMRGQTFMGAHAVQAGLLDDVCTFNEACFDLMREP